MPEMTESEADQEARALIAEQRQALLDLVENLQSEAKRIRARAAEVEKVLQQVLAVVADELPK
jgi:nitrogen-specific signal transduction histidine kinase